MGKKGEVDCQKYNGEQLVRASRSLHHIIVVQRAQRDGPVVRFESHPEEAPSYVDLVQDNAAPAAANDGPAQMPEAKAS